jgi:hypothetical protein
MAKTLTPDDIAAAAAKLGLDPCAIKAVAEVESGNNGFLPDGRVKIRFERHVFQREMKKRNLPLSVNFAGVSWLTLEKARAIHEEAALLSTSWGLFQIMGFNHAACGFSDVRSFVAAQEESELKQLESFSAFVRAEGLALFLAGKDWAGFARRYNGPNYADNQYDGKLRKAYDRCKAGA